MTEHKTYGLARCEPCNCDAPPCEVARNADRRHARMLEKSFKETEAALKARKNNNAR